MMLKINSAPHSRLWSTRVCHSEHWIKDKNFSKSSQWKWSFSFFRTWCSNWSLNMSWSNTI